MVLRVGIVGVCGRMGKEIASILANDQDVVLSAGADLVRPSDSKFLFFDYVRSVFENSDVVIDFSSPSVAIECFQCAADTRVPLVSGTTGIPRSDFESYTALASSVVPILCASNMSFGLNLLLSLVKIAAKKLGEDFDAEIFEMHHAEKVDSPSGTSIAIGEAIASARETSFSYNPDRRGKRQKGSIGVAVSRGGGVFGDHQAIFASKDEIITISHRAMNRAAFALGAVKAAKWIVHATPGLYSIADVLDL